MLRSQHTKMTDSSFQTIAEREALEKEQEELAAKEKSRLIERKVRCLDGIG